MTTNELRERSRAHLLNPDEWQWWPLCPLKKQGDNVHQRTALHQVGVRGNPAVKPHPAREGMGVVRADDCQQGQKIRVYNAILFEVGGGPLEQVLKPFASTEYASIDALLDDGWVVD